MIFGLEGAWPMAGALFIVCQLVIFSAWGTGSKSILGLGVFLSLSSWIVFSIFMFENLVNEFSYIVFHKLIGWVVIVIVIFAVGTNLVGMIRTARKAALHKEEKEE